MIPQQSCFFRQALTFDYDPLNRVRQMTDAAGTTEFAFTKTSQLASEDGPWGNDLLTNSYSQQLRTTATLGTAWTNSYGYDNARRMSSVSGGAGSFGYQFVGASGLRSQVILPNGASIQDRYDHVAQLTNTALVNSSATVLNAHSYAYDVRGLRAFHRFTDGSRDQYAYDAIGQLQAVTGIASNNFNILGFLHYGYDPAGNLAFRTNDLTTARAFATDKLNQLTNYGLAGTISVSGATTTNATNVTVNGILATLNTNDGTYTASVPAGNGTNTLTAIGLELYGRRATNTLTTGAAPQYDANGSMIFDGTRAWAYDDENQLASITETNSWKTEWIYDGYGRRRIRKEFSWSGSAWNQTNETRYIFDGLLVLQERDGANSPTVTYTRGLDLSGSMDGAGGIGGLLARTDANGSAFYHSDAGGNITALIKASQNLVAQYRYDPFGNRLEANGSLAAVNELQFSSQPFHAQSRLSLYHGRPYSAGLGRFTQADPIGFAGGMNLHRFVGNDPINNIDPLGFDIYRVRYPDWPHHEGIVVDNPDTGGYWYTDFGPEGGRAITSRGQYGYAPRWSWPPDKLPNGITVKCRIRTTPDMDRSLRDRAAQDAQGPAPRYWCLGNNCWDYTDSFVNQANNRMNPLITVPPTFHTVVNTPVVNIHLQP